MGREIFQDRKVVKRKGRLLKRLLVAFLCALLLSLAGVFAYNVILHRMNSRPSLFTLRAKWNEFDYQEVYDISSSILYDKPFNQMALILHGYSSLYLALSENDSIKSQNYIDESITSMRQALLFGRGTADRGDLAQLCYMLGRAYYFKDYLSVYHYYADASIRYLTEAVRFGYKSDDTAELLGLNYAALGMTMESISSFSEAILSRESDILLLDIAEQYIKAGQPQTAEQYLNRISEDCKDERIVLRSRYLLGEIYIEQGLYDSAVERFQRIIDDLDGAESSADAYYGLGLVYEKQGDVVKARSEWRKALRIQANHAGAIGALKRISDSKN